MTKFNEKTQCLWFALDQWHERGGYLQFRKSDHWLIPHTMHVSREGQLSHYVPPGDLKEAWHSVLGFDGVVRFDDHGAKAEPMTMTGMFLGTMILLVLGGMWAVLRALRKIRKKG